MRLLELRHLREVETRAQHHRPAPAAITRFTAGPASATTISCAGFSGMRSSEATPPIGSSVTSGVRMP